jgi:hypothetical protein
MATVSTTVAAVGCMSVGWVGWRTAFEPWIRENSSYGIKILIVHEHLFNCIERVCAGAIVEICAQCLASAAKFPVEGYPSKVRGFGSGKLRYLCLEKYIAAGSTAMKMSCGLGSSCCDEL